MAALLRSVVSRYAVSAGRLARRVVVPMTIVIIFGYGPPTATAVGAGTTSRSSSSKADTSSQARRSAIESIPLDKLDAEAQAKVRSVLSQVTVFRRLPVRVIDCDPNLYLFLIRHPDVVVNIWEVLKVSSLQLRQTGPLTYRVAETAGTLAKAEFLYQSHDTHIIYGEGFYDGPLFMKPMKGRCLMVLKTGYVREPNGRYYITTRLDTFLRVESGAAELLTKVFHPLVGKTADVNFVQTVAFLGSLSRTAEVNHQGVQRLASRLKNVRLESRETLATLAAKIGERPVVVAMQSRPIALAAESLKSPPETARVADRRSTRSY